MKAKINNGQLEYFQQPAWLLGDATALDNKLVYPFWEAGIEVKLGKKYLYVMNGNLYKVLQPHTTQADWTPDITPALWKVVQPEGVIPNWVQPTGAHDAYMKGEKVKFNGNTYESLINANTYSPTAYPAGWKKL